MTLIDPFSPTFEDYSYEPLPDVFDPADWSTPPMASPDTPATSGDADRLAAFVEFVASLQRAYALRQQTCWAEEPPDGSIILVDEAAAYVRTDPPPGEPLRRLAWGAEVGDWYRLDGDDHAKPVCLAEILGLDDPPCDRKPHSFEVLYTAADLARLAAQFTEQLTGGDG